MVEAYRDSGVETFLIGNGMRILGFVLLAVGLGLVGFANLLSVNEYADVGIRGAQDCDGPGLVSAFLISGCIAAALGILGVVQAKGLRKLKDEKLACGIFIATIILAVIKGPEVISSIELNKSAEATCM